MFIESRRLLLSPPELHHSGGAAQGAAARAGRVLHQPHDQVHRSRQPLRRPGLHLLLQRPLRRERLINLLLFLLLLPSSQLRIFLLCGESDLNPFFLSSYHFFLFQILTFSPLLPQLLLLLKKKKQTLPREGESRRLCSNVSSSVWTGQLCPLTSVRVPL